MLDQAHDLRRLATAHDRREPPRPPQRPALLAVAGGKGGVGTTTVALRLAAVLARAGRRVLVVDADPRGGNAALLCGIEERHSLADVLAGRQTWAEAAEMASGGVRLIAGARWPEDLGQGSAMAAERLIERLGDCHGLAEVAVIDVGNGLGRAVQRICWMADAIVMVTTSDTPAIVGTFTAIRALARPGRNQEGAGAAGPAFTLSVLVNRAQTAGEARAVHERLVRACRRLLRVEIVGGDWNRLLHLEIPPGRRGKGSIFAQRRPIS